MALTKILKKDGSNGHHTFTLTVVEDGTNNNNSYLSFTFKISSNSSYQWAGWGTSISYKVTIAGKEYTGYIPSYSKNTTVTLKSASNIEVAHNTDGTKTINIAFQVTDSTGKSYTCGNASASDTMTLTVLHKPPIVTLTSLTEESSLLLNAGVTDREFVQSLSEKKFVINTSTYDNATIVKYAIKINNWSFTVSNPTTNVVTIDFSKFYPTFLYDEIRKTYYAPLKIIAIDSLGGEGVLEDNNTTAILYTAPNFIPTKSSVKRNGQTTGKVNFNLEGTYYSQKIGTTTNVSTIIFNYWKTTDTEPDILSYTIPSDVVTNTGDNFHVSNWNAFKDDIQITDVDKNSAYYFKFACVDMFGKISTMTLLCPVGEYLMAKYKDRVDFKKITVKGEDILALINSALENLKPVTLYDNATGTIDNVTLTDSAGNYSYLEIYITDNGNTNIDCVKICNPNGKTVALNCTSGYKGSSSSNIYLEIRTKTVKIDGTSITNISYGMFVATNKTITTNDRTSNKIKIIKVLGYK